MQKPGDYLLRPMREGDLPLVLVWRNSKHVSSFMCSNHVITPREHRAWFKKSRASASLNIFARGRRPLGFVHISGINKKDRRAMWGFYLGEKKLPRGTGTMMGFLALELAFGELKLNKLCSEVLAFNEASLKLHKKLGFQQEGHFRKHVWKKNKYQDVFFMSLMKKDWQKIRPGLKKEVSQHVTSH